MPKNKKIIPKIKQEYIAITKSRKEKTLIKIHEESIKDEIIKKINIKEKNQTDIVSREKKKREETSFSGEVGPQLTRACDINGRLEEKILIKKLKFKRKYRIELDKIGKIKFKKIGLIQYFIIALHLIFSSQIIQSNFRTIESTSSFINLKVSGTGDIKIFGDGKAYMTDIVIINNENKSEITNTYYLENDINNITLIWDKPPNTSRAMFSGCNHINEIDLSNFDTSEVTDMLNMFSLCTSLYFLDLSNIDTSKVKTMDNMFSGCSLLKSLNLSSFDTSQVSNMNSMFYGCSSLKSLNLSTFVTSHPTNMNNMFSKCLQLEYVNLKSGQLASMKYKIFDSTHSNLMVCSENEGWKNLINLNKKILFNCINNVSDNNDSSYNIKCFTKNTIIDNNYPCSVCGNNYLMKYNADNISNINCYEYKEGYFFDNSDLKYKLCYFSCKNCDTAGDEVEHNCTECKEDYNHEIKKSSYKNCYMDIYYSTYILINTSIYQTYDLILTEKISQKESITNLISNTEKISQKESITNLISNTDYISLTTYQVFTNLIAQKNIGVENKTESIKNLINNLFDEFNITHIDNGKDTKIDAEDLVIILTSTKNQKINENKKNITMDLGQCENILKDVYNISKNDSLYILQLISEEEGMKIPKVEYEIYYPFYNSKNLTKLNSSYCE